MAVQGVTFDPQYQASGRTANQLIGGLEAGQSMMERQQAMQLRQQQADQQLAEFNAKRPVLEAAAAASLASAHASIQNATRMEQLRTQAAAQSDGFNNEFLDAMQLADWNSRSDALSVLQPKISYMALFPEYKGFVDAVNKARIDAHGSAVVDAKLEAQQALEDAKRNDAVDAAQVAAESRVKVAEIGAGARTETANISAGSRQAVAGTNAAARLAAAQVRAQHTYETEVTMEKRDEAIRNGNTEAAQIYQDRLNKMNASASNAPERALPAAVPAKPTAASAAAPASVSISIPGSDLPASGAPAAEPSAAPVETPVAPTRVAPNATSVSIGGKDYPVFKDKNGKRAYKIDGHYVPIQSD